MERNKEISAPPDGGYGWVIITAITIINICVLPLVQNFGIIYQKEFDSMNITAAQTSFLLHLHNAIFYSLGLMSTPLLKKYSYRQVALLGTSLMCLGIFLSSFAQSYAILICTVSVLIGIGQGTLLPATYVATNSYFKKRLTLAISFSTTGASLTSIFMPQLCDRFLTHFGRQDTVLILFGISLVAIICCFFLKPIKRHKDNHQIRDEQVLESLNKLNSTNEEEDGTAANASVYKSTTIQIKNNSILKKLYNLFDLELLKDRAYVIVIIGMAVSFAAELNVILMMPFVLPELAGFDRSDVALVLTIQSVADIIGRLAIPLIAHMVNVQPKVMYVGSLIISTVGRTILAIFYQSKPTIFFCAYVFGLAKGIKAVYQSVIIPKFVVLEKLAAANGLSMLLTGTVSLIIGPVIGAIHDVSNSYIYALHSASMISMSCVLLWGLEATFFRNRRTEENVNDV